MRKHVSFLVIAAAAALFSLGLATTPARRLGSSAHAAPKARRARSRCRSGPIPGSLDPQLTIALGGAVRRLVRLRHACQPRRPGQGRARALAQSWKVVSPKRVRVHAEAERHVRRRHEDDGVGGQAEPRLRRQPGEQVAAARAVHADRRDGHREQQRAHRRGHDDDAATRSCSRASRSSRSSARGARRPQPARPRHERDRPVLGSQARWPATTTRSRCARATRGGRTAPRPPSTGCPRRSTLKVVTNETDRREPPAHAAASTSRRSSGPDRARLNKTDLFKIVLAPRSRTSSSSTRTRAIPPRTRPSARRSCRRSTSTRSGRSRRVAAA